MAIKEMGIFGAPYRQALNFDFNTEDGALASHNSVVSQGAIAHAHTGGNITPRQKFTLVVTTQKGVIKLGGYYEIQAQGAVAFDGPTVGAGVEPQAPDLLVK